MAHWVAHKAVWFPGTATVCGIRLRPFALGHLRLLEIIESPFLGSTDGTVRKSDLGQAVAVLRAPWRVGMFLLRHPLLWRLAASWAVWRVKDWHAEAKALDEYIADCLWAPEMYRRDGENDDANVFGFASSFSMRIAWKLAAGRVPVVSDKVWNLTVIEAMAWAVTQAELAGRGFVTRDEVESVEQAVAAKVEAEAQEGAVA